jgi:hypothetical protein
VFTDFQAFCDKNGIVSITPINDKAFIGYINGKFHIDNYEIICK